jgi:hypothetical protein
MKATASCEERLKQCDELVEVADRAIQQQSDLISLQGEQISDLKFNYNIVKNRLEEVERESAAWYRNPVVMVPLSFIAGAYVMSQVSK